MLSSFQYPIFLSLSGRKCLVVGLGTVGLRKLEKLLACGADEILALDINPNIIEARRGTISPDCTFVQFANRIFKESDLDGTFLVAACTSDPLENTRIAKICHEHNVLCNCATNPAQGSFILPAMARCGNLCATLSTSGASPLLAAQWREELEQWLDPKWRLAWLMGCLRPFVKAHSGADNKKFFMQIAASDLPLWLENNEFAKCRHWLCANLPGIAPEDLDKIFSEYANVFPS